MKEKIKNSDLRERLIKSHIRIRKNGLEPQKCGLPTGDDLSSTCRKKVKKILEYERRKKK